MRFLYAHGFASSPQSRKAKAFEASLKSLDLDLTIPALDSGDFEHLTIVGQLKVIEEALNGQPASLIGSSMGGYLAALYASTHPEVNRLVLMAPAFGFAPRWRAKLTPGEPIEIYHYGENRTRRVHYGLIEDALRYPPVPDFHQPALLFHGTDDDVVPIEYSRAFVETHPNAHLIEMPSDHELLNVLDQITIASTEFLTA